MLIQSYEMLSIKHVAVLNSPSYRQCGPAPVISNQNSGRAGPQKSVLYKHKIMIYLICSYRARYLLYMQLSRTYLAIGSVDQLWSAANRTLAEQDLRKVCCINTYSKQVSSYPLIQSYNMLSIKFISCVGLTLLQAVQTSSGQQQTGLWQSRT